MKRLIAFIKKEFIHIARDKRTLLILIGIPVVQIILFGYAITNEIRGAQVALLTHSNDAQTQILTNKLLSTGYFQLYKNLDTENEIEAAFQSGKIKLALIIEDNFDYQLSKNGSASVQIIADATEPNTANTLVFYVSSILNDYARELNSAGIAVGKPPLTINPEIRMRYNPELKGVYLFVPGLVAIILMLISALMTSISITREKETGSMEILLASPMKPLMVIIAKVIPYLTLSFLISIIVLCLGYFVFNTPIKGNLVFLLFECILFNLTALSLGVLISSRAPTQQIALMASLVGLMMPTILLSGFIFPVENMPWIIQVVAYMMPAKWFIVIIRDIMLKGSDITLLWRETLVHEGFATLFIIAGTKIFKERLQ